MVDLRAAGLLLLRRRGIQNKKEKTKQSEFIEKGSKEKK